MQPVTNRWRSPFLTVRRAILAVLYDGVLAEPSAFVDLPMSVEAMSVEQEAQVVEQIREGREKIHAELSKVIVGQQDVIEQLLICLFAGGHCLITGAPGFGQDFAGAQRLPDLPPASSSGFSSRPT